MSSVVTMSHGFATESCSEGAELPSEHRTPTRKSSSEPFMERLVTEDIITSTQIPDIVLRNLKNGTLCTVTVSLQERSFYSLQQDWSMTASIHKGLSRAGVVIADAQPLYCHNLPMGGFSCCGSRFSLWNLMPRSCMQACTAQA